MARIGSGFAHGLGYFAYEYRSQLLFVHQVQASSHLDAELFQKTCRLVFVQRAADHRLEEPLQVGSLRGISHGGEESVQTRW